MNSEHSHSPTPTRCPRCGNLRDWNGLCPACVLTDVPDFLSDPEVDSTHAPSIEGYQLKREIGRGGMGTVWEAVDTRLGRRVAIKRLLGGLTADETARERFRREARTAGRLRHHGIVPLLEFRETSDEIVLLYEYVEGGTLADRLKSGPMPPRETALLVATLADAVSYAHQEGIIHRDLKPSNVLLDAANGGAPVLTDFGIARDFLDERGLTRTLQGLGTVSYLSPEQATASRDLETVQTDVYGLGAVLFHGLTGRAPFVGGSPASVIHAVVHEDPPSPLRFNPTAPRDLETICLKCLEKSPARRYRTAAELRDELRRFLDGRPILSRPISNTERAWRWCRRRPAIAALSLATVATILFAIALLASANRRLSVALARSISAENQVRHEGEVGRRQLYSADITLAEQAVQAGDLGRALALLDNKSPGPRQEDLRGFEWFYLKALTAGDPATVVPMPPQLTAVAVSPDGRWIAAGGPGGKLLLRETSGATNRSLNVGSNLVTALTFSADGRELFVATRSAKLGEGRLRQLSIPNFTVGRIWTNEVSHIARVPQSDWLAVNSAHRIYPDLNAPLRLLKASESLETPVPAPPVSRFAFTPDGRWAAMWVSHGENPGELILYSFPNWSPRSTNQTPQKLNHLAFSPDGRWLAAGDFEGGVRVWDWRKTWREFRVPGFVDPVARVAWLTTPELTLATASAQTVRLWALDVPREQFIETRTLRGHTGNVHLLDAAPAAGLFVSGSLDATARIWDASHAPPSRLHFACGFSAATPTFFLSDDHQFALVREKESRSTIREYPSLKVVSSIEGEAQPLFLSPGAREAGFMDFESGEFKQWFRRDSQAGRIETRRLVGYDGGTNYIWLEASPDRRWLCGSRTDASAHVWSLAEGALKFQLRGHQSGHVYAAAFSPDSRQLATPGSDGVVRLWDLERGEQLKQFVEGARIFCVRFSPEGKRLVSAGNTGRVSVWDVSTGERLAQLPATGTDFWAAFSPDGRTLATLTNRRLFLWSTSNWRPLFTLNTENVDVGVIHFGPDSRSLWLQTQGLGEIVGWIAR